MEDAVEQFTCPTCGAEVTFRPGSESLTCGHCGATIPITPVASPIVEHSLRAGIALAAKGAARDLVHDGREVHCKTCGAQVVTAREATRCPFCDSAIVIAITTNENVFLPESILPFKVDKTAAQASWLQWMKSRWFAPNDIVRRSRRGDLDGCYLPYWTFDSNTTSRYGGERGDYYYETEHYKDAEGKDQTRKVRRTRWCDASGTVDMSFDDVLVSASESLPRSLLEELEPWNLERLQPFDGKYLAGFIAERYQIDLESGFELAKLRMKPKIRSAVRSDIGGDEQRISWVRVTYRDNTFKHLLLPLWISSYRYKDQVFRAIVNAQTGDVAGERPYSILKIAILVLFLLIVAGFVLWAYIENTLHTPQAR